MTAPQFRVPATVAALVAAIHRRTGPRVNRQSLNDARRDLRRLRRLALRLVPTEGQVMTRPSGWADPAVLTDIERTT